MKRKYVLLMLFGALMFVFSGCTSSLPGDNPLSHNNWQYALGSANDIFADTKVYSFKKLPSPEMVTQLPRLLPPGQVEGFIWLKNSFVLPEDYQNKELALFLARVTMADETYVNGHMVGKTGSFPPNFFSEWNRNRLYQLHDTLLFTDKPNELLMKIYVNAEGAISGDIGVAPRSIAEKVYNYNETLDSKLNAIISFLILMIGCYHILIFVNRTKDKENLYYGLLCFVFSAYLLNFYITSIPGFLELGMHYLVFQKFIFAALFLMVIVTVQFFKTFLQRNDPRWIRWLMIITTVLSIGAILIPGDYATFFNLRFYVQYSLLIPIAYLIFMVVHSTIKRTEGAKAILIGTTPLLFCGLFDLIVHIVLRMDKLIYLSGFGFPAILVAMAGILARRFVQYHNQVEEYKENLEEMVKQRTEELHQRNQQLTSAQDIMRRDMDMAINVQKKIFPPDTPPSEEWEVCYVFKPMAGVSGDMYDFYTVKGQLRGVGLFDVSGHGIASGLITILAKSIMFRSFHDGFQKNLSAVIEEANDALIADLNNVDNYLTGILLRMTGDTVEYVNAGHTELLYRRASTGSVGVINLKDEDIKGLYLGIEAMRSKFTALQFKMEKNDVLLLHSDCLNETVNDEGEEFGSERIMQSLREAPNGAVQKVRDRVLQDFMNFVWPGKGDSVTELNRFINNHDEYPLKDDFSMIIIRRIC